MKQLPSRLKKIVKSSTISFYLSELRRYRFARFAIGYLTYQEKMRGQRWRLPVQALGYVNSTKVILGLPKTAGVHFLLRSHDTIL